MKSIIALSNSQHVERGNTFCVLDFGAQKSLLFSIQNRALNYY